MPDSPGEQADAPPAEPPGQDPGAEATAVMETVILGDGPRYTPEEIWQRAGVSEALARRLWLAMGFPNLPDDAAVLTERDLKALTQAGELLAQEIFDSGQLVLQTRVMSQALSAVAAAHAEAVDLASARGADGSADTLAAESALAVLDDLLAYLYRRHLLASIQRMTLGEPDPGTLPDAVVGFADLTDFSATVARSTADELMLLVDDFASLAADLVASAGGRVVKLIGDEVMFTVSDPVMAADLALDLIEAADRPDAPAVHAGLALGPVLSHHGDLFGSTVNVASRLSDLARPGTVLVNEAVAGAVGEGDGFEVRRVHLKPLKGIGPTASFVLRRAR